MKTFHAVKLSDVVFIRFINVKMPTIIGILTFVSLIKFMLCWVVHEKSFITSGPGIHINGWKPWQQRTCELERCHYGAAHLMSAFKTSPGSIHDIATKRQPLYLSLIELSFQGSLEISPFYQLSKIWLFNRNSDQARSDESTFHYRELTTQVAPSSFLVRKKEVMRPVVIWCLLWFIGMHSTRSCELPTYVSMHLKCYSLIFYNHIMAFDDVICGEFVVCHGEDYLKDWPVIPPVSSAAHFLTTLFVCLLALRPKSTAMVMAGRSLHLTTLFPGQAWTSG